MLGGRTKNIPLYTIH